MATQTWDKPLIAQEGETVTLASDHADYLAVKPGFDGVIMYCASAWRRALAPALLHVLYYDATDGSYTNYRAHATDGLSTTHVPLDAMPTADFLYLGFSEPVLGVYIDVGANVNAEAATLAVKNCTTAVAQGATIAFTDVTGDSDGTDNAGATLGQDGAYVWTLPTNWVRSTLGTYASPLYSKCYWIQIAPSATLSATVDINEIIPIYKNASYAYMEAATSYVDQLNYTKVGGFTLKGTGAHTLNVSWLKHG